MSEWSGLLRRGVGEERRRKTTNTRVKKWGVYRSPPVDSFVSVPPLAADLLHPGLSVDESPTSQARCLLAMAERLRDMAFALDLTTVHSFPLTPEVPVQPTIALQAHHTTFPPLP